MICKNCGTDIGGNKFCPRCGAPAEQDRPVNALTPTGDSPTKILIFGILSLALGSAVIGLIFSIMGMVKANRFIASNGNISKQVSIGKKLAIAVLVISIICLVCYIIGAVVIATHWNEFIDWLKHEGKHSITIKY